jgi:hypothetical protein
MPTGQRESEADGIVWSAVALSAGIILTTIHTQDYKDVPGDTAAGRVTLPIAHPALSRVVTAFVLITWSWGVSRTWRLDDVAAAVMGVLALGVGISFVTRTDPRADKVSFYWYNVSHHTPTTLNRRLMPFFPGVACWCIFTSRILQAAPDIMTDHL